MDQVWTVAVTLVRHVVPPICAVAFAGWLLLAHNPLLLDCAVFWTDRLVVRTQWLAQWAVWIVAVYRIAWRAIPHPIPPTEVPPPLPREPRRSRRLCSNGDHSNAEETRIVICEHLRKILGAVLIAAVLSWVAAPAPSPSTPSLSSSSSSTSHHVYTPPVETNRLSDPWIGAGFINADVVNVRANDVHQDDTDVDNNTDDDAVYYLPPRHYRRPPSEVPHGADPRVHIRRNIPSHEQRDIVVRKSASTVPRSSLGDIPPIGASGFAAARKAARAAQNAAADQWVLAMRKRLMDENSEAKGLSVRDLHSDDDEFELARAAFGLGCSACGDGSVGVDVDSLFGEAVQRRERRGYTPPSDDWYKIDNPHDQPDDALW